MNIGFFQTAFLGDLLLGVPVLRRLKLLYPEAKLSVFCRNPFQEYILHLPWVDEAYGVDKDSWLSRRNFSESLRAQSFDLFLCPHVSPRTHLWLTKVRSKRKIGYRRFWNRVFFDERVAKNSRWPEPLRQLQLLSSIDEDLAENLNSLKSEISPFGYIPNFASMTVGESFWDEEFQVQFPPMESDFVCLAPGSVWNTKRWSRQGYAHVASALQDKGYGTFLIGAPAEKELCQDIASQTGATSLAGTLSLWQTQVLIAKSRLLIANDSGAGHMASLGGTPCLSIFGPTTLDLGFQPWNPKAKVLETNLECRPCGRHGHKTCPIGTHQCMRDITEQQVLAQSMALLNQSVS